MKLHVGGSVIREFGIWDSIAVKQVVFHDFMYKTLEPSNPRIPNLAQPMKLHLTITK